MARGPRSPLMSRSAAPGLYVPIPEPRVAVTVLTSASFTVAVCIKNGWAQLARIYHYSDPKLMVVAFLHFT